MAIYMIADAKKLNRMKGAASLRASRGLWWNPEFTSFVVLKNVLYGMPF